MKMWECPRCALSVMWSERPRDAGGTLKKHCGCRNGMGGRLGTSKYEFAGSERYVLSASGKRKPSAEFKRMASIMALPGYKPVKHDAHVRAHATHQKQARIDGRLWERHSAHVTAWRRCRQGAYWSHRYRTDPEFNAREKVKARLRRLDADADLQRHMAEYVKASGLPSKWEVLLGYSMRDLVQHLQRTLPTGSKWEQFLSGTLHIDHILPRASFDLSSVDELKACWSLGNLRLLPAQANMRKGAAVEFLI